LKNILISLLLLAILLPLAAFVPGCWDKDEPDEVAMVIMAAFDIDEESGLKRIAVQIANPLGAAGQEEGNGEGPEKGPTWALDATGHSAYEAIQNLELVSTRALDWSHLEVLVISEAMAERGIRPILDYFDRERQSRMISRPLLIKGEVMELMEMEFPLEAIGGEGLSKHMLHVQEERSVDSGLDSIRIMFQQLSRPGQELVLPLGEIVNENKRGEETEPDSAEKEDNGEEGETNSGKNNPENNSQEPEIVQLAGSAVFRGNSLAGFLDDRQSAGYLWITGELDRATLRVSCPGCEEASVTLEVFQSEKNLEPEIRNGTPVFHLQVGAESRIQDLACPELPPEEELIETINRRQAALIRNEIEGALDKARELEADVFGLGHLIYRKKPTIWDELEEDWPEIFTEEAKMEIEVETVIMRHGQVTEPITIR